MGRRKSAAISDLISSGLLKDGELLRYKNKQGQLLLIGRARPEGIEVHGSSGLLNFTAFEAAAGSKYHRPAEHTHALSGASLQGLQLRAITNSTQPTAEKVAADGEPLFEESHDEFCYICGLGGDLMCCEGCPATMHARCAGLEAVPEHDWYCPWCHCTACGQPGWDPACRIIPQGVCWVECGEQYSGMHSMGDKPGSLHYRPALVGGCKSFSAEPAAEVKPEQESETLQCSAATAAPPACAGEVEGSERSEDCRDGAQQADTPGAGEGVVAASGVGDAQSPADRMEVDPVPEAAVQPSQQESARLAGSGTAKQAAAQTAAGAAQGGVKQEDEPGVGGDVGGGSRGNGSVAPGFGKLDLSHLLAVLRNAATVAEAAAANQGSSEPHPLQAPKQPHGELGHGVGKAGEEGGADAPGVAAASPPLNGPVEGAATAEAFPAEARCACSGRRTHAGCLPVGIARQADGAAPDAARQQQEQADLKRAPPLWFSDSLGREVSCCLAQLCAHGVIPLGALGDGTPLSFQLVRGAAVAAPAQCGGCAPRYNPAQKQDLREALSAAAHILHGCYQPLVDSRTGADAMLWMLRGACLAHRQLDFSTMHTALLYVGTTLASVGCLRLLSPRCAELPLLATRPELQRNALGSALLAALEAVVGGVPGGRDALLLTPAYWGPGQPYLAYPPGQEGVPDEVPIMQARWGYTLASRQQLLEAWKFPLVRLPGVLLAGKEVGAGGEAAPGGEVLLPWSLCLNEGGCDLAQLIREGVATVARQEGARSGVGVKVEAADGGEAGGGEGGASEQ